MHETIEDLLLSFSELPAGDLPAQLMWIESVSIAATNPEYDFGAAGERAALDLRAALGAIIVFAKSAQTERDRLTLELTVRALLARALSTLYGALSDAYKALAEHEPHRAECRSLARIFKDVQRAAKRGDPISPVTMRKLETLRAQFSD